MADVQPFRAFRPAKDKTVQIASLPYDVYNREEAQAYADTHPGCFLAIDRPETFFDKDHDMYAPDVYRKAHDELWRRIAAGDFVQEDTPCYYLYEQTFRGRTQAGIVALASVDGYERGIVKKHENTRRDKEEDRVRHVAYCQAQTGPIFLCYRRREDLAEVVTAVRKTTPFVSFTGPDGSENRIFVIDDAEQIVRITAAFADTDALYIADGHHRCASAVRVGQMVKAKDSVLTSYGAADLSEAEASHFLSVLFADDELEIMDYNRVVTDLGGLDTETFLQRLEEVMTVQKCDITGETETDLAKVKPAKKGDVAMYLEDTWYALSFKPAYRSDDPVEGLDASLLQNHILRPVLGIDDPRTDKRIDFVGGIRGLQELVRRCHTDAKVAFALYPTSIAELFAVADASRLMPPKSTWFEPKLLSGLFVHALKENYE